MRNEHLNYRIYLSESKIKNIFELLHKVFENLVFFRWIFFKNRPRSTFLLTRAFLITSVFCFCYLLFKSRFNFFIMGLDIDPVLVFFFMGILGYWNMLKGFYDKNNYCSNLYNEIIKEKARGHQKSSKILSLNLSSQLLAMDLWAHRIYSPSFVKNLEEAIIFCYSEQNKYFKPKFKSLEECFQAANNKKLNVGDARNILLSHQYYLEDHIS